MTGIETNFQLKSWKSQIANLASELTMACANMPDSLRRDHMIDATIKLGRAADMLDLARAIADPEEVKVLLALSVQEFRQKAEQKRCQEIGSEVLPKMETADARKVSRFPKPTILQSSNGE
jgi:hypothetical protein